VSRINALRIINLNYNNNTIKIDDEIFDLASESTLMSLRNGGGKTVLVQMMMAPYVSKRNRDLKDRKFKSYFQNTPTYILTEWQLDSSGGYLLAGMAVRKKPAASDEDSEDELDIFTFLHQYDKNSTYDIYSIPIIEMKKDGRRAVKGYGTFRAELEEARKNLKTPLDIYNMNQYEQSRRYYQKLKEYKIDSREWDIIHKINLKESGLSELFSDAKSVEGLVEKWFLTTVEDKLNKTGNKIRNFNEIVKKYIYQYKEIQSKIQKRDAIDLFCGELEVLVKDAEALQEKEEAFAKQKNIMANFIKYLNDLKTQVQGELDHIRSSIAELDNSINDLRYQEISKEWYCLYDELDIINNLLNRLGDEEEEPKKTCVETERQLNIYECAELYEDYKEKLKKLRKLEVNLENINKEEEEKTPERNNLGYSLRLYYEKELGLTKSKADVEGSKISDLRDSISEYKGDQLRLQGEHVAETAVRAGLEEAIKYYAKEEENFEKRTGIKLNKNILGVYEDDFLENTERNIRAEIEHHQTDITNLKEEVQKLTAAIDFKTEEQQQLVVIKSDLAHALERLLEEQSGYEKELSLRKDAVRILNLSDADVYNKELIMNGLEDRVSRLAVKGDYLAVERSRLENEKNKLEKGILTEIPAGFKEKLDELDIEFVYGMEWLNRNNRTGEENEKIIRNNPLLPYALIMNEEDLIRIQKNDISQFTSAPVPIIKRTSVFNETKNSGNICYLDDVTFYVSFDNRLIHKEELAGIIVEKEREISNIEQKIKINSRDKKDYEDRLAKITATKVESKLISSIAGKIENTKKQDIDTEEKFIKNSDTIKEHRATLKLNNENHNLLIEKLLRLNGKLNLLTDLEKKYGLYMDNKNRLDVSIKEIEKIKIRMEANSKQLTQLEGILKTEEEHLRNINSKVSELEKQGANFSQYKEGCIIDRDFEFIKSQYDALTDRISGDKYFVEKMKNAADGEFVKAQDKLIGKQSEYMLAEPDYRDVKYDGFKHREMKTKLEYIRELLGNKKDEIHGKELDRAKVKESLKNLNKSIYEKFGAQEPKDKELIKDVNFKSEIKNKIREREEQDKILKSKTGDLENIQENILKLDQYRELELLEKVDMNVPVDKLEEHKNSYARYLEVFGNEAEICRKNVERAVDSLYADEMFRNESIIISSLDTIKECVDVTMSLIEQLSIVLGSCRSIIEKLRVDIEFIYKDEEGVLAMLSDYLKDVHNNLAMIDDNSSVNIDGRSIKMLKIKLPEWESNEEAYKNSLKFILEKLRDSALKKLSENEAVDELISKTISTYYLYNNIVGISNIEVKLYKIEETRQTEISWNNVSTNSGGEGFLSAFVVLSSLLTYMRRDETDIFSNSRDSKVIVMDNPFAQTNAEHLLKPLINMADKSNTQLICFSGLGGDSIYNRFNNIYVLETKQSGLKANQQYLKHTHEKGEEIVSSIHSSRFKIEEVPVEQMRLF